MRVPLQKTDEQFQWEALLQGDKEALSRIYKDYFNLLYEYGVRLSRDPELVKDCIQELFIKLWVNRRSLKPTDSIKAYLYTALRRTILNKSDQLNRRKNRETMVSEISRFDLHFTVEHSLIFEDEQRSRKKQILQALNSLTARQKEAIFLRFYLGLEYEEIAAAMQITVKASYKIIGRAIGVMRKYFKKVTAIDLIWGLLTFLTFMVYM